MPYVLRNVAYLLGIRTIKTTEMGLGKIFFAGMAAMAGGTLQSCLKEAKCPPSADARLYVAVEEKNYENVDDVRQAVPVDEGLPFARYVAGLDLLYRPDAAVSLQSLRRTYVPADGEKVAALPEEALPEGSYEITVAGNAAAENIGTGEAYRLELHPGGAESNDLYLADVRAAFPLAADRTLSLKRTKGVLLLYYEALPGSVARVGLSASGVSGGVDEGFRYSGTTMVNKEFVLPAVTGPGTLAMRLAPTVEQAGPQLSIRLSDADGNPVRVLSEIALSIARNRITALELRYDPDTEGWEIWMSVEGVWVQIHRLTIQ